MYGRIFWLWKTILMAMMERFLGKMDLAVFMALVAGKRKVGKIAAYAGHSDFRVREALKRLQEEGLVERPDYRSWQLSKGGHEVINDLWKSYVELFGKCSEAHEMIASTLAETHKLIPSGSGQMDEAHEMIASSAQNDRFEGSSMHEDDHAWMDVNSFQNSLADSDESVRNRLEEGLIDIGFDQPERWLRKENVSWELVSDWLAYVNGNGRIRNKAGFVRSQVEAGERPNLGNGSKEQMPQYQVPAEYEGLFQR